MEDPPGAGSGLPCGLPHERHQRRLSCSARPLRSPATA